MYCNSFVKNYKPCDSNNHKFKVFRAYFDVRRSQHCCNFVFNHFNFLSVKSMSFINTITIRVVEAIARNVVMSLMKLIFACMLCLHSSFPKFKPTFVTKLHAVECYISRLSTTTSATHKLLTSSFNVLSIGVITHVSPPVSRPVFNSAVNYRGINTAEQKKGWCGVFIWNSTKKTN